MGLEGEEESRDDTSFGFSLMSDGDCVPKKLVRKIVRSGIVLLDFRLLSLISAPCAQDAGGEVNQIQHSSQGSMFATSGVDSNIIIWDTLSCTSLPIVDAARCFTPCMI